MNTSTALRLACLGASLALACGARAESIPSSASVTGSASSGSVSASLHDSSHSSDSDDKKAEVDYRVIDVAAVPGRADLARLTLQTDDAAAPVTLDLPQTIAAQQRLARGDTVHASKRVYGYEFARGDTREAFFLVLADAWYDELAARPLSL